MKTKHTLFNMRDKKSKVIKVPIEFITIDEGSQRLRDMLKVK